MLNCDKFEHGEFWIEDKSNPGNKIVIAEYHISHEKNRRKGKYCVTFKLLDKPSCYCNSFYSAEKYVQKCMKELANNLTN